MGNGPTKRRFEEIFRQGKRVAGPYCRITALPGTGHFGVATSRKTGNRPQRNRVRRRYQSAVALSKALVDDQYDYIIVVTEEGGNAEFTVVQTEVARLLEQLNARWASESESS